MIGIEDLNVAGMVQNHNLARAVSDANMSELHRQITYKGGWGGSEVVEVGRWEATSQTCSQCGVRREGGDKLGLGDRVFVCADCGFECDRDHNAARNIRKLAAESAESINAGGP